MKLMLDICTQKFEGKKYRETLVGRPNKSDGVFIEKKVWDKFLENHNNILDANKYSTYSIQVQFPDWQGSFRSIP